MPRYDECSIYDLACREETCDHKKIVKKENEAVMDATDVTYNLNMLVQDGDEITFVTPDGNKFRAHNIIRPHGKKAMVVSLIADVENDRPKFNHPNTGELFTPVIKLSSPEDRRKCCGALKIQQHMPSCEGPFDDEY